MRILKPSKKRLFHTLLLLITMSKSSSLASTSSLPPPKRTNPPKNKPPIVYTIAGSDSGGGAGIQADLHTIHSMGCHGCSAVVCLTAQNSCGVTAIHSPPPEFLREQLDALKSDLEPRAIKVGMLGSVPLIEEVGKFLKEVKDAEEGGEGQKVWVVVDPVMITTSGHRLLDEGAQRSMVECVFPYADVLTPNKYEAEALLHRKLTCPEDVEQGARDLLAMGVQSVLIKGGHTLVETNDGTDGSAIAPDVNATLGYAQDYFLSRGSDTDRMCDGPRGVWIRNKRYDSPHTHGTGCTLSSAIASALALGHLSRETGHGTGAMRAIQAMDACCLAKAYVTAGIGQGVQLGKGSGPVAHTKFPSTHEHYPTIAFNPTHANPPAFLPMISSQAASVSSSSTKKIILGKILPIVSTTEWITKLCETKGITDVQLRIKDPQITSNTTAVTQLIAESSTICSRNNVRLWINDYWKEALSLPVNNKPFGIHLGQEDLTKCIDCGGIAKLREAQLALGISTHSFGELSVASALRPSYISLGPIYDTTSKDVNFEAQTVDTVRKWRELVGDDVPLVGIGGINDAERVKEVRNAGVDCVAVIGAVTKVEDLDTAVDCLIKAMN